MLIVGRVDEPLRIGGCGKGAGRKYTTPACPVASREGAGRLRPLAFGGTIRDEPAQPGSTGLAPANADLPSPNPMRLLLALLLVSSPVAAQDTAAVASDSALRMPIPRRTAKPPLHARHWIAITGKPLAATAGAMMFQKGGNAVDAAAAMLAASATMWDVLSWGGETQALIYHPGEHRVIGINALGVAPAGATADY